MMTLFPDDATTPEWIKADLAEATAELADEIEADVPVQFRRRKPPRTHAQRMADARGVFLTGDGVDRGLRTSAAEKRRIHDVQETWREEADDDDLDH